MRSRRRRFARQRRKDRALTRAWDFAPYVCPGCYAVGGEPCAPDCIDDEMDREREAALDAFINEICPEEQLPW